MENDKKIELLYKEYTRLNQRLDNLIDGSLSDFKLLSFVWPVIMGVGALAASDKLPSLPKENSIEIGFGIFLGILLVVGIIAFRDLLKLSQINYHIYVIKTYEDEISKVMGEDTMAFNNIDTWISKFSRNHSKLYIAFTLLTILPLTIIPTLLLYQLESKKDSNYWVYYLLIAIGIYALHFIINNQFLNKPMKKLA